MTDIQDTTMDSGIAVFRFKFDPHVVDQLTKFAKIHQFDDRVNYKEAWTDWLDDNDDIVENETERLRRIGYTGDVPTKMYKSCRYYFRNKSEDEVDPRQRRVYIHINKEVLDGMDEHIRNYCIRGSSAPASGYDQFCQENVDMLRTEVIRLVASGIQDHKLISQKIKKTYKNRYFQLTRKA